MNAIRLSRIMELTGNAPDLTRNDTKITYLCSDSRKACVGCAFFCIVGSLADGHEYARSAYERGCRVFICERMPEGFPIAGTKLIFCKNTREALADVAAEFFGHPERAMRLIGITGTKGKTTVASMIAGILNDSGVRCGYIGTNGVDFDGFHIDTVNTTPESRDIYEYLSMMLSRKVRTAVIEVSSQALKLDRIRGLKFDVCVFTNLYHDHIGGFEHPDYDDYRECKKRLFSRYCARYAIINADSPEAFEFERVLPENVVRTSYSISSGADVRAASTSVFRSSEEGTLTEFVCRVGDLATPMKLKMSGSFNVSNALAAVSVVRLFGIPMNSIAASLAGISVAGRSEAIHIGGVEYIIDYAHNGESLRETLTTLRQYKPRKLTVLFGSVGGRTKTRRGELGAAAAELADFSILTSDNPDNEAPEDIIADIAAAFPDKSKYIAITDRAEAIAYAVRTALPGDIVLLAGKGHEKYQLICGRREPFCERDILLACAGDGASKK